MAKENSAVALKEDTSVAKNYMDDMESMAGMGAENVTAEDMSIPFLQCAQALSPEVNKRDAAYIDTLEAGDFFNKASKEIVGRGEAGFRFIPVLYKREYLEWVPRDAGGGFAGSHGPEILESCEDDGKGVLTLRNGNEIVVTGIWYGLTMDDAGNLEQAVISLSKTQFKKSRTLASSLMKVMVPRSNGVGKFNPPFFYNVLRITSVPESNDHGNWMGWKFSIEGSTKDLSNVQEVIETAVGTHKAINSGQIKAQLDKIENQAQSSSNKDIDGDIPF